MELHDLVPIPITVPPRSHRIVDIVNIYRDSSSDNDKQHEPLHGLDKFQQRLRLFGYFLNFSAMGKYTNRVWRWILRIVVWGCIVVCGTNIVLQTRSYRDGLFDSNLLILHITVMLSFEMWVGILQHKVWSALSWSSSKFNMARYDDRIRILGILSTIGVTGATSLIYGGWATPIGMSIAHPMSEESGGWYIFLWIHGVFLFLIIVPWACVCLCGAFLYDLSTLMLEIVLKELATNITAEIHKAAPVSREISHTQSHSSGHTLVSENRIQTLVSRETSNIHDRSSDRLSNAHNHNSDRAPVSETHIQTTTLADGINVGARSLTTIHETPAKTGYECTNVTCESSERLPDNTKTSQENKVIYIPENTKMGQETKTMPSTDTKTSQETKISTDSPTTISGRHAMIHDVDALHPREQVHDPEALHPHEQIAVDYHQLDLHGMQKLVYVARKQLEWICHRLSPMFVLWIVLCDLLKLSGSLNIVRRNVLYFSDDASVHLDISVPAANDVVFHYLQDWFYLLFGTVVEILILYRSAWLTHLWSNFLIQMNDVPCFVTSLKNNSLVDHAAIVSYIERSHCGYYVFSFLVTPGRAMVWIVVSWFLVFSINASVIVVHNL